MMNLDQTKHAIVFTMTLSIFRDSEPKDPHNPKKLLRQLRFMFAFVGSSNSRLIEAIGKILAPLEIAPNKSEKLLHIHITGFPFDFFSSNNDTEKMQKNRGRPWGRFASFKGWKAKQPKSSPREESPPLLFYLRRERCCCSFQPAVFNFQKVWKISTKASKL